MNKQWARTRGGIIAIVTTIIFAIGAGVTLWYTVFRPSNAFSSSNTSLFTSVGEILVDPTSATGDAPFSYAKLTTLVNMIYGQEGNIDEQIKDLSTRGTALSAANLRSKSCNKSAGNSIVVRLGGLDWIVTYVSNDVNGDLIATLWLTNNHQDAWSGKNQNLGDHYGIANGGLYSDWSDDWYNSSLGSYPSNMYGTSYIRVETLNNPTNRKYATSTSGLSSEKTQSTDHIFSLYTVASKGLTQYLATPSQMPWMINMQNPANRNEVAYWLNNESITTENLYGYEASSGWHSTSSTSYNYTAFTGYKNWQYDYLWLPSMAEMGYNDGYDGLWETSVEERMTYNGSSTSFSTSYIGSTQSNGSGTASVYTWGRSAYRKDAYSSSYLYPSGSSYGNSYVYNSQAVRPSLLISLNSAASHAAGRPITVTLDSEGGSGGTNQIVVAKGDVIPAVFAPVKNGYIFGGYYTAASGGGSKIFDQNGQPAIASSTFTSNTTLYAKWTKCINATASGSTVSFNTKLKYEQDSEDAKLIVYPQSGYYVSAFSFNNNTWIVVERYRDEIFDTGVAMSVVYWGSTQSNMLVLEFNTLFYEYNNPSVIPLYLQFATGTGYQELAKPSAGGTISGVAVQATFGGSAYIVGDNLEALEDDDTITCAAFVTADGYEFLHWADADGRVLSTRESERFLKSVVMDSAITAVFAPVNSSNVNLETDNT